MIIRDRIDAIVSKHSAFILVIPHVTGIWYEINGLPEKDLIEWAAATDQKLDISTVCYDDTPGYGELRCNVQGLPYSLTLFLRSTTVAVKQAKKRCKEAGVL